MHIIEVVKGKKNGPSHPLRVLMTPLVSSISQIRRLDDVETAAPDSSRNRLRHRVQLLRCLAEGIAMKDVS
jgi:hypothetical protein|tara:strand:- start:252 stop:464 length:213 start_codon:yes stop_codon:yes gene_type:complete